MTVKDAVKIGLYPGRYHRETLLVAWDILANLPAAEMTREALVAKSNIEGRLYRR